MAPPLLQTKLYIPAPRPEWVQRPRLVERLHAGLHHKLTLVSAPAGFGKTTLLSEWAADCGPRTRVAWLSLDNGDNDLARFLTYFVAALQSIQDNAGQGLLVALQYPEAVNIEVVLTTLLNDLTELPYDLVLVLDDYHVIESQPIDQAIAFLLEHLPAQVHLVIASRIDPSLPLSRLRARGQMTEIRANDLRFMPDEATAFLQVMGFDLSTQDGVALEMRTEGWIAGLQLAALSMKGFKGKRAINDFINSFTGSNRYIQDYLADEVLQQQSRTTRDFLLQTSILNRMSAPLCDAVRLDGHEKNDSQTILENLETANLFIVPLDNERRWYRYHHLFTDLLRQRLVQQQPAIVDELHIRASAWYEKNGLEVEAFHHAATANDVERAERLIEGNGTPLHFRGVVAPVLNWLESLPTTVLDARPSLWVTFAKTMLTTGHSSSVEEKLQAAEAALEGTELNEETRDTIGRIANTRANFAVGHDQVETILAQSNRALEYLHPDNLAFRAASLWTLGVAHRLQGNRAAASQSYTKAISISQASGNVYTNILATTGLADVQLSQNQLYLADETYRHVLNLVGDLPIPVAGHLHLCLGRISYEWNDLDAAQQHVQQSSQELQPFKDNYGYFVTCEVFLARLKLAQRDVEGASAILTRAKQFAYQHNFAHQIPEVAAVQALLLLRQDNLAAAAQLAERHNLPIIQARVHLVRGEASTALAILDSLREQRKARDWKDEILKIKVLQAVALHTHGETDQAVQFLGEALALAEAGGFIRTFVDEGAPMMRLLYEAAGRGIAPGTISKLLAAFEAENQGNTESYPQPLIEPLSPRELQVLQLLADGLSNREISERLFVSVDTIKGHNSRIYGKLGVKNRTRAVKKAILLKIIPPQ